jgi:hypothetical protein
MARLSPSFSRSRFKRREWLGCDQGATSIRCAPAPRLESQTTVRLMPGKRYHVFADPGSSGYVIGVCTRTSEITSEVAQRDLRALGQPRWQRP